MSIDLIEQAVGRGQPFTLKVADGDEYSVPHPDYISLPPKDWARRTFVIVYNDTGTASYLPLLTITSLTHAVDGRR